MWVWRKLTPAKWRDAWEERFQSLAETGLVITEVAGQSRLRVEMFCRRRSAAERIRREFGGSVRELRRRNWAALAVPRIKPMRIRDRLLVVSEAGEAALARYRRRDPGREVLVIPVEMAFGTGDHPTTATCLRLLCDLDPAGKRVLDLGCGTGILGLAARKLGAREVLGIDYDPKAVAVARANARRNGVRGAVFRREDLFKWTPPGRFDLILANIFADVLTAALPKIRRAVPAGGTVVLSGILDSSAPAVLEAGRRVGLEFRQVLKRGKWVTAVGGAAVRGRAAGRRPG